MEAISSFFKLCQNYNYIEWADSNKEQFGENQISKSCFLL